MEIKKQLGVDGLLKLRFLMRRAIYIISIVLTNEITYLLYSIK
nr:MAG TPA: hypothetical protein [Caudoviricetes sp.]DAO77273.1 MAG TPA: hypothetical protein [Caudoviricetes sp.]